MVNLLTLFARSEALFEPTPAGPRLKPLVVMLTEARGRIDAGASAGLQQPRRCLLFIAGFFARGFAAKLVDIDYHIAMGGRAYGTLADTLNRGPSRTLGGVFAELAAKFQPLVDCAERTVGVLLPAQQRGSAATL